MKKLLVLVSCAFVALLPATASSHPGVDCRNQNSCINHCLQYHRGVDRAVCLVSHNILN